MSSENRPARHLDPMSPSQRKNAELLDSTIRQGPVSEKQGEPKRWCAVMGHGIKEVKCYPLTATEFQARERALILWPGWSVISIAPHVEGKDGWRI